MKTPDIAAALHLPTITVRRALEDLTAYHLLTSVSGGKGKPDGWRFRGVVCAPYKRLFLLENWPKNRVSPQYLSLCEK